MFPDDCRVAACSVSIASPGSTVYTSGSIPVEVRCSGRRPDRLELLVDGQPVALLDPPFQSVWDTSKAPEGEHQLVARATQGPSTYLSEPRTVVVDRTNFRVAIYAPADTAHTNGEVTFQLALSGPPAEQVELIKDGVLAATLAPPYAYVWEASGEAEGSYQFAARARSGATVFTSEPRTVVVDRTPPTVVYHSPVAGDRNVGLHDPVLVVFSEPVQIVASPPEAAVALTGNGGVALSARLSLSEDRRTLNVGYVMDPAVPSDIALALRPGIADLAGNPLELPGSWSWHVPVWQRLGDGIAQGANISGYDFDVDAAGKPTVVWGESGSCSVARWTGARWEVIGANIHGPAGQCASPVLALRPSGEPILAFTEDVDPDPNWYRSMIFVRQSTPVGWEYVGQNPIGAAGSMTVPTSLVVDSAGGIWLGYEQDLGARQHALVSKFDGSFYWLQQGEALNRRPDLRASGPRLAFDVTGSLWAGWAEYAGYGGIDNFGVYNLFSSKFVPGAWVPIGGSLNDNARAVASCSQMIPMPGGYPIVTWTERVGSFQYPGWYRVASSAGWGPQAALSTSLPAPSLAVTSAGELYRASPSERPRWIYRKKPDQGAWQPVASEEYPVAQNAFPNMALIRTTPADEVLLMWTEWSENVITLYVKRLNR